MANTTLTSTLAGIMETLNADVQAVYSTRAGLIEACTVQSGDASSIVFPIEAVPSAATAVAEDGTVSATTVTLEDAVGTFANYPVNVNVSNLALRGGSATSLSIANTISGKLAAGIDTQICEEFTKFDNSAGSTGTAFSLDLLIDAQGVLNGTGYAGQMIAVVSPKQWSQIAKDAKDVAGSKSDEIMSKGYVANLFGIDVFVSSRVTDDETDYAGGLFFKETGVGLAVRNPVVDMYEPQLNSDNAGHDFYGEAQFAAINLTDALGADNCLGGVKLVSGI